MVERNIFVALPAYDATVSAQTLHSLFYAKEEAEAAGWSLKADNIASRVSDADIARARNAFLGWFLQTDCTDLFFVDTDVSWRHGAFTRLFSHGVDVVCGAYRTKRDVEKYPVLWPDKKSMMIDEASGQPLLEIDGCGFGMMRLSRKCVETINAAAPRHFFDEVTNDEGKIKCPWVFEWAWVGEQYFSEDYMFAKFWQNKCGGKVWVDPSLSVDHIGKKTFEGNLYSFLQRDSHEYLEQEHQKTLRMLG